MAKDDKNGREKGIDPKVEPIPKKPTPKPRAPEPEEALKAWDPRKKKIDENHIVINQ